MLDNKFIPFDTFCKIEENKEKIEEERVKKIVKEVLKQQKNND